MAVSLDVGPTITVHGDARTSRRSGRVRKPTAKVRVVEQVNYQDNAELEDETNKLSNLVQDLLRRDAEREQFLKARFATRKPTTYMPSFEKSSVLRFEEP
ncbi:uncharacterized protein ColSpa_03850 [Colletotrichum spaethianum]|uniref:Uncharacterized protein n=1 Tax=Colletotrichum spaethianum TaxID=700344 RepID=A0AA37P7F7_9PEZI|nr:uncharacterized protein ColSpa_03850 [Colletotrichum spaethianum]GKT43669.1 hypothetical protein ColSpa_03850 [Colletotrichum spaethianum]